MDVLRQSVEKSELWVYKSRNDEDHTKSREDEDENNSRLSFERKEKYKSIGSIGKQGSAIDLDIGPPIHVEQAEEYKKIQLVIYFLLTAINNLNIYYIKKKKN